MLNVKNIRNKTLIFFFFFNKFNTHVYINPIKKKDTKFSKQKYETFMVSKRMKVHNEYCGIIVV